MHGLPLTFILFLITTIQSNQFRCNYLRKKTFSEFFSAFLKSKSNVEHFEKKVTCIANVFLNFNLIYEPLWTGVLSGLLISMLGKLGWFCLTGLITTVLLMWKQIGLFLRKNHVLRCWVWPSLLNWIRVLTLSLLLKLPPRKLEL